MPDKYTDEGSRELFIESYLRGKVAVSIPDNTISAVLAENGVSPNTPFSSLTDKQRELCLAGVYVYASGLPTTTEKVSDSDADWSHSEGGQMMSANVLNNYLRMANAIYKKYGLSTVGDNRWGMVGHGFHHIRNYGDKSQL